MAVPLPPDIEYEVAVAARISEDLAQIEGGVSGRGDAGGELEAGDAVEGGIQDLGEEAAVVYPGALLEKGEVAVLRFCRCRWRMRL